MKKDEILALFEDFEQVACETNGIECWSARELSTLLGYTQWRNFTNVVDKAKEACQQNDKSGICFHNLNFFLSLPRQPEGTLCCKVGKIY